jgi:predicted amidohydrolase
MVIIGLQFDISWEDKRANHAKVGDFLNRVSPPTGALVVLPEMFATGFSMNVDLISDAGTRQTQDFLSQTAQERRIYLIGGVVRTDADGRGLNEAIVYGPAGETIVSYTKMYPFTPGGESIHYQAGVAPVIFDWEGFTVAPFICYDLRFPEVFRTAAGAGANLLTVIASWPAPRINHWRALLIARAIENQSYVIGVNRCGRDPNHIYPGGSLIVDPHGKVLSEADDSERAVVAEPDISDLREYRTAFPVLSDLHRGYVI